ncbi:hypothetical protein AB0F88_23795 [Streptosporangium sp. NPDC023963]|uniref:hypothetical protein n=1 Tax=Streptosporangium sp. NPDC023963 TaxID=3155608 RepID=UPI00342CD127
MGAGRGALVARLGGPVRGGAVRVEAGLADGFWVPFGGVVGRWDVDLVGLGAGVAVGAGLVAVAVALGPEGLGPGRVGSGSGAGLVALSEGSGPEGLGVAFGGCGFPVAVGLALGVDEEVALADGAGVVGTEVAVDVADGFVSPGGAGVDAVVLGGSWVAFLLSGGAFVGAAFFWGAWVALLVSFVWGAWVALLVSGDASAVGSAFFGAAGGASVRCALLDGGSVGTAFLDCAFSREGGEDCSAGTFSSVRGAVFRWPGRLRDVGGALRASGGDASSEGGFLSGVEPESRFEGGLSSGPEVFPVSGTVVSGGDSSWAGGGAAGGAGGTANSCDGESELTPGSARAAHGWAMTALVVADTAASRRPESKVTRRDELRGGIDRSSWIYGVGSGPEMGFQPAAVNSGVPGRATCGTEVARGSGTLTQSPWFAPRMPGCQTMSRLMAYGLA